MQTVAANVADEDEAQLVKQFGWVVESLAARFSRRDPSLFDDLHQIGLMTLIEMSRKWRKGTQSVASHAYPRIRGAMLDSLRKEDKEARHFSLDHEIQSGPTPSEIVTLLDLLGAAPDQEQILLEAEEYTSIDEAINSLPERERCIVTMRFYEGAPLREIAAALRMPLQTVADYLARALKHLREKLSSP
jgi:RNA polymerase sigma factor (sigma-70 family)